MIVKFFKGINKDSKFIREEVFIKEQGFNNEFDDIDNYADTLVVYDNDIPIATGRVYAINIEDKVFKLGRIAVISSYRQKGVGKIVINNLEQKAISLGAKSFLISAQLDKVPFYQKCGYNSFGDSYYDEHVEHISMKKQANI